MDATRRSSKNSIQRANYEFVRMSFGLKNAPATFQRVIERVLKGLQGEISAWFTGKI